MPSPKPERQLVTVPVTGGLGTDVDQRMRPPETLEVARNVRAAELGGLQKRYGFTKLTRSLVTSGLINDDGPVRGLAHTSKELLAIGHHTLYAYSESASGWLNRGVISPCNGQLRERFRTMAEYDSSDLGRAGDYIAYGAIRYEDRGDDPSYLAVELRTYTEDGEAMHYPATVRDSTSFTSRNFLRGVRCASHAAGVVIAYAEGEASVANELKSHQFRLSNPATIPVPGTTYTTDLWEDIPYRTYDLIGLPSGGYVVAWIADSNRAIEIRTYNSSHVQQNAGDIAELSIDDPWKRVALAVDADDNVYVLGVAGSASVVDKLRAYKLTADLGTVTWGPISISNASAATDTFDHIGCTVGTDVAGNKRMTCVWGEYDNSPESYTMHVQPFEHDTGSAGTAALTTYNVIPQSRPFYYRGRAYAHVMTVREDVKETYGYETHLLVDLGVGGAAGRFGVLGNAIAMSAMWGVGQAPGSWLGTAYGAGGPGSCGTVDVGSDTTKHRFVCPFLTEVLKPASPVGPAATVNDRVGWDEVTLTFDESVTVEPIFANAAVIGGGYVSFYDGTDVHELGFATPPMVETVAGTGGGSNPTTGTHTYYNMWEHMGAGVLHRSHVSPGISVVLGSNQNVALNAFALAITRRKVEDMTCQWFRQSSTLDTIPRRVNRAEDVIRNQIDRNVPQLTDAVADANITPPIYTTGGVLEAVAPEGARIVTLSNSRVVLGDFFRGSRVQYSHQFEPQTGGEVVIAPEFVEPLGKLTGHGDRITGIAPLDTATVVFDERTIYLMSGYGPDRAGRRDDIGRLTTIPVDTGCNEMRSVVVYPEGVMYGTSRGIYALTRDQGITPIGEPVRDLLDDYPVITSAVLVPEERQVRFTCTDDEETDGRILVYDYRIKKWFEWEVHSSSAVSFNASSTITLPDWLTLTSPTEEKSVQDSATTVTTGIGADTPRAFSQDGITFGLLLEPAATNLVTEQDLTAWSQTGTCPVSSVTLPTGASGNARLTDDDAGVAESRFVAATFPAASSITASTWGRHDGGTGDARFRDSSGDGFAFIVDFNSTSWARYSGTGTTSTGGADNFVAIPRAATADTGAADFWGMQIEARAYPTSFIGADNATFTRAVETLRFDTAALAGEGGRYNITITYRPHYAETETAGNHDLIWWDSSNRIYFRKSDAKIVQVVGGVELASDAITAARHTAITITAVSEVSTRSLTVSGADTGNGTTTGTPTEDVDLPTYGYLLGTSSGAQEGADLRSISSAEGTPVIPVGATYVHHPGDTYGSYYFTESNGQVWKEDRATYWDNGETYVPMVVELAEFQPAGSQAWMRVGLVSVLAERKAEHGVKITLAENFAQTPSAATATLTAAQIEALADPAGREQLHLKPPRQRLQALRVRIEDYENGSPITGEGFILHTVTFEVGLYGRTGRSGAKGRI